MAYYEDIADVNGEVNCVLCELSLADDNNSIDSHINGDQHTEFYIRRIMIRNSIMMQEGKHYCLICDTNVCHLENHTQSIHHQYKMNEIKLIIEKDGAFMELPTKVTQKESVHCTICNCYVDYTIDGVKDHIQSMKHKWARSMAVQPFNGIFSIEGSDIELWCKICQMCFENYVEVIFDHVYKDERHTVTLKKILRLIDGQDITIDRYLTNAIEDKATCNKCGIEVPCNVDNLERHVKGNRHKKA